MAEFTYIDAIRQAQHDLLEQDERVFIYGQDVGKFGGAFKATQGLQAKFPGRVIDSPISEDAMIGMAIGAAVEGMRPLIEVQFADFSSVAFNQIVNHAGTHFYRTGVPIPITVRLPSGGTPGSGPFHSQMMEAIYAHYPGLVVVTPATVSDAYSMLIDSVKLDDPVLYCEHKFLYRWLKSDSMTKGEYLPIGKARIVRAGKHATVVAYSAMVHEALRAAERLAGEGWEVEVVDLRSVKPLDTDTVMASVARTGRLLVIGESFPWGGVTAEVVSRVVAEGFHLLDAPPQRLNARDTPVPYHPNLWEVHRPTLESICQAIHNLLNL
ncbi:MAG: alpha-ketoacid dehydrogenase subunit beta [Verrucomicrobia bacterium]|nr:alpha-ketoacid dehydrogenase subunit beta [Verrucomicrobiota bacterium]